MEMNLKPIHEQVVVVIGANSGIGRETALRSTADEYPQDGLAPHNLYEHVEGY